MMLANTLKVISLLGAISLGLSLMYVTAPDAKTKKPKLTELTYAQEVELRARYTVRVTVEEEEKVAYRTTPPKPTLKER